VHSLTVRVKGKVLLENTNVTIAAGRRYGLAGPNGMGKSTLLRLLARRQARCMHQRIIVLTCAQSGGPHGPKHLLRECMDGPFPVIDHSQAVNAAVLTLDASWCRLQVPVPEGLDVLLVEQEVVGTEQSALQVGPHHAPLCPAHCMLS